MKHTIKPCNEPLYHLYSPLHLITTILHALPPTTDQFLKAVMTELHILFLDSCPDIPSFLSGKKVRSCLALSVDCTAGVVRW